jgi:hypothetical protein
MPDRYAKEVEDRVNSTNAQKTQAMQGNLFGGLDEIPVDTQRENAIAKKADEEYAAKLKKMDKRKAPPKPPKSNLSDEELQERIKESNEYYLALSKGKNQLEKAQKDFYRNGEPPERSWEINQIFNDLDTYKETGDKRPIVLEEREYNERTRSSRVVKTHKLDPSNDQEILDYLRTEKGVDISPDDTIASVEKRYKAVQEAQTASNARRPEWMDKSSGGGGGGGGGTKKVGAFPSFVADQLFKLNAFDFPSAAEYGSKEIPKITIRLPGGTGQYQIPKTQGAVSSLMKGLKIGPKEKEGETLFDALKRHSKGVQNFSEFAISYSDRRLMRTAINAANNFPEPRRTNAQNIALLRARLSRR